jgi:hypothetical protein
VTASLAPTFAIRAVVNVAVSVNARPSAEKAVLRSSKANVVPSVSGRTANDTVARAALATRLMIDILLGSFIPSKLDTSVRKSTSKASREADPRSKAGRDKPGVGTTVILPSVVFRDVRPDTGAVVRLPAIETPAFPKAVTSAVASIGVPASSGRT